MSGTARYVVLVFVGVLLAQAAWILAVPPFRGSDEFDHAFRAAGVASGQWRLTEQARDGRGLVVEVPADLVAAASGQCESLSYTGHDNCHPISHVGDGRVTVATAAGNYNPLFYWVIGTAAKPFHGAAALYAMRIATAVLCAVGFALGVGLLASGATRPRWLVLGLFASLTPTVVYSSAVAAPNGPEMAAGLLLWASLVVLGQEGIDGRRPGRLLVVATVAAMLLAVLRTLGPLWIGLVVIAAIGYVGVGRVRQLVRARPWWFLGASAAVALAVAAGIGWALTSNSFNAPPDAGSQVSADDDVTPAFQIPVWTLQLIGAFPYRDQPAPAAVYPMVLIVVVTMLVVAVRRSRGSARWAIVGATVVALLLPVALTMATMGERGAIWQGRYQLPFVIGIMGLCGLEMDRVAWAAADVRKLLPLGLVLLVVAQVVSVVHVMTMEEGRAVSASDAGWVHPPVAVVGALMLLGWTGLAALARERGHD